ncbi:MAG: type IV secretion system DNA-binding domain-containing protein [Spirochaetes bacterium]|nr:type IV secretion system DNA-binding domain-containing protein [Spirochaetota bacterium]
MNIFTNSFKAFEHLLTQWRMFFKMTILIFILILLLHSILLLSFFKYKPDVYFSGFSEYDICIFQTYVVATLKAKTIPFSKKFTFSYPCEGKAFIVEYDRFKATFQKHFLRKLLPRFKNNLFRALYLTSPIYIIYVVILAILSRQHIKSTKDKYRRGKLFVSEKMMAKLLAAYETDRFKIRLNSKIFVPEQIVTKHCFAIGATGSGKSQLAFRVVEQLIKRNVRCIIHDFKGDFIPTFYNPKRHYIFNPLDKRHMGLSDNDDTSRGWSVFNELYTLPNVDSFVSSMIPDGPGEQIWYTAPRDLYKAMIIYCIKNNLTTNAHLNNMIETSPDRLRGLFEKTPGCKVGLKHLEEGKLAGQFMSILATYTASLSYLVGTDGNFSIRKWISDENSKKRVIFLANQAEVQKTLKTLISTFFDFSTKAMCTLPDDPDGRRIYFILDEFGQLSKMDSVVQLLTQGRSKGAATWIFCQDIAQVNNIYGNDLSKSIVNGCRNKFYFNVSDYNTADFISKEIGHVEIERSRESKSFGVHDLKDSISIQNEIVERPIAMPSEISSQKNLTFFLQLADIPELTHIKIDYKKFPYKCNAYDPRDIRVSTYGEDDKTSPESNESGKNCKDDSIGIEDPNVLLFDELAKLPSDSEDTRVDPADIPDMNGGTFVPEEYSLSMQSQLVSNNSLEESEKDLQVTSFF